MTEEAESPTPRSGRPAILRVLMSESFLEKLALLIVTGLLSGIVIPVIVKSVDAARDRREATYRAQAKLFDEVSETILTYESLVLDVSWFGTATARNQEMQKRAFERYTERTVDLTSKWRAQISRAQTLASPQIAPKLEKMLLKAFTEQDTPIYQMWNKCGHDCDWDRQHKLNTQVLEQANALISELAVDLGLMKLSPTP